MASYDELRRKSLALAKNISELTEVDPSITRNVVIYAKQLTTKEQPDVIDELIFIAQMGLRFGISSRYHLQLMLEATRQRNMGMKGVRLEDFVRLICIFMSPSLDLKIDYVFSVYDFKHDGFLDLSEITALLKPSFVQSEEMDPAEALADLINIVMNVTDANQDNLISLEEFRAFVKRDILCIQLFGNVLPEEKIIDSFHSFMKTCPPHKVKQHFIDERSKCLCEPVIKKEEDPLYPGVTLEFD